MFATVFKAIGIVLMDTFETREFIFDQIAYSSSCNASMQPPLSLTFIHGPVILPYISNAVKQFTNIPDIVDQSDIMNDRTR